MLELTQMIEIAQETGGILKRHFRRVQAEVKADGSMVSEADREAESWILERVIELEPSLEILAEESVSDGKMSKDWPPLTEIPRLLAIDPLDGTNAFLSGFPIWGISMGLLSFGVPTMGVLYFPQIGELYAADADGATFQGAPLSPARHPDPLARQVRICAYSNVHRHFRLNYPGKLFMTGSSAYHIAAVARGTACASLLSHVALWDIAAGLAICRHTGHAGYMLDGTPFSLDNFPLGPYVDTPFWVCAPEHIDAMLPVLEQP